VIFALFVTLVRKQLITYSFTVFIHVHFGKNLNLIESLLLKEQRKLELKNILIGVAKTKCLVLNYLIVLGKLHLWNCRRNDCFCSFSSYKYLVKRKYETECHIAALKYNNAKMLEAKWKSVANCNLLGIGV